jgi:prepilin-type N-terminal cleavage/methylation domain-containing protein
MQQQVVRSRVAGRRGFTVVELIVVVGVVAVLLGLLFPALASVRGAGRMTTELSAARQLMAAYSNYSVANRDLVLPGYDRNLRARDDSGNVINTTYDAGNLIAARYPWRLAPYLDYNFEGLYNNEHSDVLADLRAERPEDYMYIVSLYPSLGLNSVWVGGHQGLGLRTGTDRGWVDAFGRFYVTRMSEVRRADEMLVFASARRSDPFAPSEVYEGAYDIQSPYRTGASGELWAESWDPAAAPGSFGNLSFRHEGEAVTAFIDGHTETFGPDQLRDMRYWARDADAADWTLEPRD